MEKLVDCLKEDKARMEVGKINRFGVLVMTRQRLRPSLQQVSHEACPTCQGTGKVKSIEALVLSVVRRIKAILSRDAIAEIRVKLMPAIALAVLNQKRKELTTLEDVYDSHIVIVADPEIPFGEMAAEIERAEEGEAEKAPVRASRDKHVEVEDETVVLGGDTPISFEKALGEEGRRSAPAPQPAVAREPTEAEIKYERRDAQRAALDERERLRALFESAKPLDDDADLDGAPVVIEADAAAPAAGKRRGRGNRKPVADRAVAKEAIEPAPAPQDAPAPQVEETVFVHMAPAAPAVPEPTPILLTADLVADMLTPSPRPRLMGAAAKAAPVPETPAAPAAKRGRPRAKAPEAAETVVETPADAAEPAAKRGPKAKAKAKAKAKPEAVASAAAPAKSRKK